MKERSGTDARNAWAAEDIPPLDVDCLEGETLTGKDRKKSSGRVDDPSEDDDDGLPGEDEAEEETDVDDDEDDEEEPSLINKRSKSLNALSWVDELFVAELFVAPIVARKSSPKSS